MTAASPDVRGQITDLLDRLDAYHEAGMSTPKLTADLLTAVRAVEALTYASDDGTEYEHDHGPTDGYPECPACWAEDIRAVLAAALLPNEEAGRG